MEKTLFWGVAIIIAALLSSCNGKDEAPKKAPTVRLATVEMSNGLQQNSYPGKTQAAEESQVAFRVAGTLASVPVKVGDYVRKGQVLARMDSRDYQVQLTAIKAEYESTKAECERIIALYKDNGTSANNYDKARYGLEQITQKLKHAQDQMEDCVIRAPFDGYVQTLYHEAHETVGAGMPVVGMFANKGIEVVINIPVVEFNRKDAYDYFTASFSTPECTLPLKLVNISRSANANQLYQMRLLVADGTKDITPGLTTVVNIHYKASENKSAEVPSSAVFADGDKSYVYVYSDSTVHKTEVSVQYLSTKGTMRISQGLASGQKVVLSGVHHLVDGQKVRPAAEPSKTNVGGLL